MFKTVFLFSKNATKLWSWMKMNYRNLSWHIIHIFKSALKYSRSNLGYQRATWWFTMKNQRKKVKNPKKPFQVGFFMFIFWGFMGWVFWCQPWVCQMCLRKKTQMDVIISWRQEMKLWSWPVADTIRVITVSKARSPSSSYCHRFESQPGTWFVQIGNLKVFQNNSS